MRALASARFRVEIEAPHKDAPPRAFAENSRVWTLASKVRERFTNPRLVRIARHDQAAPLLESAEQQTPQGGPCGVFFCSSRISKRYVSGVS